MEDLLEFLFNATGRINRARYLRSLVIFGIAGLFVAVILFTAAGIATPLFVVMLVIAFIPWLMWGFAIHTERPHDRSKSAWWLLLFCVLPTMLGHFATVAQFAGPAWLVPCYVMALASSALAIWGFVEIGCLPGTTGPNGYGPDPLRQAKRASRSA
jgi:uncharacterized membrane protein YhaH (DUF805 family)